MGSRPLCRCVWLGFHCPNEATQEDGLCDWCAGHGTRTEAQLRRNRKALISPVTDEYLGLGGADELHDFPLADERGSAVKACWYPDSGRRLECASVHGQGCARATPPSRDARATEVREPDFAAQAELDAEEAEAGYPIGQTLKRPTPD